MTWKVIEVLTEPLLWKRAFLCLKSHLKYIFCLNSDLIKTTNMRMLHKFFQDKVGLQGYWRSVKATYTLLWGTTVYYYGFFGYESIPESHDFTLGYVMLDVLCFPKQANVVKKLTLSLAFVSMDIFVLVAIWNSNFVLFSALYRTRTINLFYLRISMWSNLIGRILKICRPLLKFIYLFDSFLLNLRSVLKNKSLVSITHSLSFSFPSIF